MGPAMPSLTQFVPTMLHQSLQTRQLRRAGGRARGVQCSAVAAPAAPPSVAAIEQLRSWASKRGVQQLENVGVSTAIEDGRPILVAAKDIGAGQTIFSVPDSTWLGADAVRRSSAPIAKAIAGLEPWLQAALLLVHERFVAKGEWADFVASLPSTPGSPLFWSEAQLEGLRGSQVLQDLQGYRWAPHKARTPQL